MSKDKMSTETSACFFIKYVKDEGEGEGEGRVKVRVRVRVRVKVI